MFTKRCLFSQFALIWSALILSVLFYASPQFRVIRYARVLFFMSNQSCQNRCDCNTFTLQQNTLYGIKNRTVDLSIRVRLQLIVKYSNISRCVIQEVKIKQNMPKKMPWAYRTKNTLSYGHDLNINLA